MKFGVREICNVVFRATTKHSIGNKTFEKGQPVFYLDSAKTSSMEGATTTVYAQGGRGNTRLIAWEGERTLTFTVEDALLSPISFAMLSGAGVLKGNADSGEEVHFHQTTLVQADDDGIIDLTNALEPSESIDPTAPLFIMSVDEGGDIVELIQGKFQLLEDKDYETTDGQKLMYTDDLNLKNRFDDAITDNLGDKKDNNNIEPTGNAEKYAYAFPYTIDTKNHIATEEEVEGWNTNKDNTGDDKRFAEPIPKSVIKTMKLTNSEEKFQGIPTNIWKVQTITGKQLKINMPEALSNPVFSGADLQAITPPQGSTDQNKSNSILSGSNYKVVSGLSELSYLYLKKPTTSVKVKVATDNAAEPTTYSVTISPDLKNQVLADYFGIEMNTIKPSTYTSGEVSATTQAVARDTWEKQYAKAKQISDAYRTFEEVTGKPLMVDYYVIKKSAEVTEIQIDASNFGGYYYVEADTLFRRQIDGKDIPANLTFPNVKIQSNFTFSMAATGDPSTFTFTMDAFPGYTYFDHTKKVLCAMQLLDDKTYVGEEVKTIFPHKTRILMEESKNDSSPDYYNEYADTSGAYVTLDRN